MKTYIILVLLIIFVGGVAGALVVAAIVNRKFEQPRIDRPATPVWVGGSVSKVVIEGHDYLSHSGGGLVHSESCTNHAKLSTGLQ